MVIVIGLVVVVFLYWSFIKARARIYYANKHWTERELAEGGEAPYPSWMTNNDRIEEFVEMLNILAKRKSIPKKFVAGIMTNEYSRNKLFFTAGLMEQQGASFDEQTLAVMDQIEKYWMNTDLDDRKMFEGGT
jgi:hypothetical protein